MFREVWPEDSYFGKPGLNSDDELDILKQIFHADLGTPIGIIIHFYFYMVWFNYLIIYITCYF